MFTIPNQYSSKSMNCFYFYLFSVGFSSFGASLTAGKNLAKRPGFNENEEVRLRRRHSEIGNGLDMLGKMLNLILFMSLVACSSELTVNAPPKASKKVSIETLDKITAMPGDHVKFVGQNLSLDLQIFVNGKIGTFKLDDASNGSFIVPDDVGAGLMQVSFTVKDKDLTKFPLMNAESVDSMPIIPVPEESACSTLIYKNQTNDIVQGKANCSPLAVCSSDGQTDCLSNEDFPAVATADISTKLVQGVSLAGVAGLACTVDDLSENRATIAGAPTGSTDQLSFTATIAGEHITAYRYKLRSPSDPHCSHMDNYSGEIPVSVPIGTNDASESNGPIELCVIGKDDSGQWQTKPSIASWAKARTALAAAFSGEPRGVSNSVNLNVTAAGAGVSHYKYKIRGSADSLCSASNGYSTERSVSLPINDDITSCLTELSKSASLAGILRERGKRKTM